MAIEMVGQDLYLRHTAGDGKSHIVEHRVWDAEKFLNACQRACNKVNEQESDPRNRQASVTMVTREQYQMERA
jgi:triphosphoribosyl-dephospho-CoA synthetase